MKLPWLLMGDFNKILLESKQYKGVLEDSKVRWTFFMRLLISLKFVIVVLEDPPSHGATVENIKHE